MNQYYNSNKATRNHTHLNEETSIDETSYHISIIVYAIIAIFCYYLGAFLIVFIRNDLNGALVSAAPDYDISWRIAFENFPQLLKNLYDSFFGYFAAYSQLYNRNTVFLIPVDIGIKLVTIGYFLFFWIPWDTNRAYKLGLFNDDYPYVDEEFKDELDLLRPGAHPKTNNSIALQKTTSYKIPTNNSKPLTLYPEYNLNPYLRAQKLKAMVPQNKSANLDVSDHTTSYLTEEEEEYDSGIIPFSGVYKPLEEIYQKYEKVIYDLIRKRVLPGSNILIVGYFSTLFIVDLANPITVVLYILGIMSMFWCMQSFLLVIDYLQFTPD